MGEWWVERWFRRLDERGVAVEFVADGRAIAGSWCPLCDGVMVITWTNSDIAFACENSCDEEFVALELGALE